MIKLILGTTSTLVVVMLLVYLRLDIEYVYTVFVELISAFTKNTYSAIKLISANSL